MGNEVSYLFFFFLYGTLLLRNQVLGNKHKSTITNPYGIGLRKTHTSFNAPKTGTNVLLRNKTQP